MTDLWTARSNLPSLHHAGGALSAAWQCTRGLSFRPGATPASWYRLYAVLAGFAGFLILMNLFPGVDLWLAAQFYSAETGTFRQGYWYENIRDLNKALPACVIAILAARLVLPKTLWPGDTRALVFLFFTLVVGNVLLVNMVLKDNWGRPRPVQTEQFGGPHQFVGPALPSDACARNCSFASGEAALGFSYAALGAVSGGPVAVVLIVAGTVWGAFIGWVRIAMGGHYFSDVASSAFIIYVTAWFWLHIIYVRRPKWVRGVYLDPLTHAASRKIRCTSRHAMIAMLSLIEWLARGIADGAAFVSEKLRDLRI